MDEQLPQVFFDAVQALMMVLGAFVLVRGSACASSCGSAVCTRQDGLQAGPASH